MMCPNLPKDKRKVGSHRFAKSLKVKAIMVKMMKMVEITQLEVSMHNTMAIRLGVFTQLSIFSVERVLSQLELIRGKCGENLSKDMTN